MSENVSNAKDLSFILILQLQYFCKSFVLCIPKREVVSSF